MRRVFLIAFFLFMTFDLCSQAQGEVFFNKGDFEKAAKTLEEAAAKGLEGENTFNMLGLSYTAMKDYERALEAFKRGEASKISNKAHIYFNEGNLHYIMKDFESAIECYTKALEFDTLYNSALLNRANAKLVLERFESALADYKEFIKRGGDANENITALVQKLETHVAYIKREEERKEFLRGVAEDLQNIEAREGSAGSAGAMEYESGEGELD